MGGAERRALLTQGSARSVLGGARVGANKAHTHKNCTPRVVVCFVRGGRGNKGKAAAGVALSDRLTECNRAK